MTKLLDLAPFIAQPPFASAVIFELRKSVDNNYFVQVLLKNNTPEEPISYEIFPIKGILDHYIYKKSLIGLVYARNFLGCDNLCPLSKFLNLTEFLTLDDSVKACQHSNYSKNGELTNITLGITFSFAALFCLTFTVLSLVNYYKLRSNDRVKYHRQSNL
jgi:hypothetical protein